MYSNWGHLGTINMKTIAFSDIVIEKICREAMLAEMGVAIGVDGHTVGLFQPRRVSYERKANNMIHVYSVSLTANNIMARTDQSDLMDQTSNIIN